jgi:uncharacterized membrane protein
MPTTETRHKAFSRRSIAGWWIRYAAYAQSVLFCVVSGTLLILKHDSFHTQALDLAKFDQAIWNTLRGRFLFTTVQNYTILGNHFSPLMALLSPLFLVWSDVRVLFLVQSIGLAVSGLLLSKIVQSKHPALAPWFLLAFYLNPALHEVALVEFRRVTLAVPFLALALYALYTRKRVLMTVGLIFALLCKENIALIVFMVGLCLIVFERDWRWGLPLATAGIVWVVVVTLWVIPAFRPSNKSFVYPQLNYFGLKGSSYQEIWAQVMSDLGRMIQNTLGSAFDRKGLLALWRVFLPLGFVLPFLSVDWALIVVPSLAYMLLSVAPAMHALENWYMASILPGLFAAVAVSLTRCSARWAGRLTAVLLAATIVGYVLFSHAPLGGQYEPELYQVTEHHRLASQAVDAIPDDAKVAAQDPFVPHLSHREHIYLYPWVSIKLEDLDYILLDRNAHPYPLQSNEMDEQINNLLADVSYSVELEADGIYVFRSADSRENTFEVNATVDETMRLDHVEVAVCGEDGFLRAVGQEPVELGQGEVLRVSLYWKALAAPGAERTISVRILDSSGALVAAHDSLPGMGNKPTSWWQEGWEIRDVYYLTIPPEAQLGPGSLTVLVYDTYSYETLPFSGGTKALGICEVRIVP